MAKVLVLAAGRSKRMQPVADKNFLDFMGKSLIERQIGMVQSAGFDDLVVVGGEHNLERLRALCDEISGRSNIKISVVEQKNLEEGMCGAVLAAQDMIGDEPVLVFSSNDVVEVRAFELLRDAFERGDADSCILGKKVDKYFPGGYLEVDNDGMIGGIVEKPGEGNEPSKLVNLVLHLHREPGRLIEYLEKAKSEADDKYEIALDLMIKDGIKMRAIEYDGFWQPVKFPWHIMKVFRHLFSGKGVQIADSAEISDKSCVKGDVIICEGVKLFEGAVVNGPAYIGPGAVIANNALVRDSYIGEKCVIGFSSEVARSYLSSDVWTHSNYIGDSVIGNNVSFGSGSVTGNLRLDEENVIVECDGVKVDSGENKFGLVTGDDVRVGVNVSFMPGVTVGAGSFVGAGIVVAENIPEKSFIRGIWKLKINENKCEGLKDRGEHKNKL